MYHYLSKNANDGSSQLNTIHLSNKHDPNNINGIHVFFCVSHKILYSENSKMRFLWNHDNGKTIAFHDHDTLN